MQRRTPDAVRSRAMAAFEALLSIGLVVAYLLAGPRSSAVGPKWVYRIGGVSALAAAIVLLPMLRLRRVAEAPEPAPRGREPAGRGAEHPRSRRVGHDRGLNGRSNLWFHTRILGGELVPRDRDRRRAQRARRRARTSRGPAPASSSARRGTRPAAPPPPTSRGRTIRVQGHDAQLRDEPDARHDPPGPGAGAARLPRPSGRAVRRPVPRRPRDDRVRRPVEEPRGVRASSRRTTPTRSSGGTRGSAGSPPCSARC